MKKVLLAIALVALSLGSYAQTGSKAILPKIGYQTEYKRVLFGIEGRYFLTDNIRLAPDVQVLLPKNRITGLDVNVNVHYVIPLEGGFVFYPLVGGAMLNNRWKPEGIDATSWTDFGINLGAGIQYDVMSDGYLNFEFKYTLKEDKDPAYFMLGYGIRF
ncbi:MAG: outer membrane protein [Dysgonomonas sp.]